MIDLYSDTKTRPTTGMRAAMAAAAVGDEQADEDPTTSLLCERVARLLGMEAGVFMPSGTMCNLAAILAHTRPGDELICDHRAHIHETEAAGAAVVGGVGVRPLMSPHGVFTPEQVRDAIRRHSRTAPRSALLAVEQTTFSAGSVWPLDALRSVRDVAREAGLRCHMDGARLLNACAASGTAAADHASGWDSAWIDLSKGLGCPVGAVLCGGADFIDRAWQWKYRLGGAMRQSGILAAAGLYALDHHVDRLNDDHRHDHPGAAGRLGPVRVRPADAADEHLAFSAGSHDGRRDGFRGGRAPGRRPRPRDRPGLAARHDASRCVRRRRVQRGASPDRHRRSAGRLTREPGPAVGESTQAGA